MNNPDRISWGIALLGCILLMAWHADERFNTPLRNRSTTRHRKYQHARIAYIGMTTSIFAISAVGLDLLAEFKHESDLMILLIFALFFTDGIPHLPFLREFDHSLLEFFKRLANIPREVQVQAEKLKLDAMRLDKDDLSELKKFIEEQSALPNELQSHLRIDESNQLQLSEVRFTRVLKLYKHLVTLTSLSKYARFFEDYTDEWEAAQHDFQNFCYRSVTTLELAIRYREENAAGLHSELLNVLRENFRVYCHQVFTQLALLLAGALVSSEQDEEQFAVALGDAGFEATNEKSIEFPVDEVSFLAVVVILYVFITFACAQLLLGHLTSLHPVTSSLPMPTWPVLTALSYITALITTIMLLTRYRRALSRPTRPWGKYIICGALAAVPVALLCGVVVASIWYREHRLAWQLLVRMPLTVSVMCFVVAFFCESEVDPDSESVPRHVREAITVAGTTAFAGFILDLYLGPLSDDVRTVIFTIAIPFGLAFIVGLCIPYMYRMSRYVAPLRHAGDEFRVVRQKLSTIEAA